MITSDNDGSLVFRGVAIAGNPVATLSQGQSPLLSVTPMIDPSRFYSEVTALQPVKRSNKKGGSYTAKNQFLSGVTRPWTFVAKDTQKGDIATAARAELGRMIAASIGYTVELSTWLDESGNVWEPNRTITLDAPDADVYNKYELLIKGVTLQKSKEQEKAVLNLVLPEAYTGDLPTVLPWQD